MRFDYHQLKQTGLDGKNINEIEVRYPIAPGFQEDKDIKTNLKLIENGENCS